MLEGFLNRSKAVKRLRVGLFGSFLESFVDEAVNAGYRAATIRMQLSILDQFQSWLAARDLAIADLNPAVVDKFVQGRRRWRKRRSMSRPAGGEHITLQRLVQHLEARGVISLLPPPKEVSATDQLAERFGIFLKRERGLNPKTIQGYVPYVRRLLEERFRKGGLDLSKLTPNDVSRFITRHAQSMSPKRAQLMTSALRSFFRFLLQHGEIEQDLAAAVPTVADWRRAQIPQFITQTQVRAMLETCGRSTPCGRRNYALLLILARLGLRASEVMDLRLKDIDWRTGEITVHGKGKLVDRLPLPQDVGEALADYLQHGRPKCKVAEVFVRDRAPHRRFGNASCVSSIVRRALHRAGLADLPKSGAQILRSSLATAMLHDGASMSEIGEVLRHRSPNTTELYVKVDFEGLRSLAQPWPGHGGAPPMSKFHDSVAKYLALRRSLGFIMNGPEYILRRFATFTSNEGAPYITNDLVMRWLEHQNTVTPATRSARLSTVRRFTIWQRGIDPRTEVPPEQMFYSRYERKRPYIYTQEEIQGILAEAWKLPSKLGWRAQTHATYFGLLVITGMRMSEALALDRDDVDLAEGILRIRRTKFGKSRFVPVHPTTSDALKSYAQARDTLFPRLGTPAFFVSEQKTRLSQWAVRYNFAKVCSGIGLRAPFKGSRHGSGPRLHDLRHRFAVNTMVDWYRKGVDVERNMPKLSAYLGHTHGHDTYWYIEAVPELLQLATQRLTKATEEVAT